MADYPASIWIREPVLDGRLIKDGGLTRGMELLDQARDEIVAIETELGTDVAGTVTDLAARLAVRMSPSGIGRGRVYPVRQPNSNASAATNAEDWFNVSPVYIQFGYDGAFTGNLQETITFGSSYTAAPEFVLAQFVPQGNRCGDVQVINDSITTTQFKVECKQFQTDDTWDVTDQNWRCLWAAFGGTP